MEKFVLQINVAPPHNLQEAKELLVPDTTAYLQGVCALLGQGSGLFGQNKGGPAQCCAGDHDAMPYWCLYHPMARLIFHLSYIVL